MSTAEKSKPHSPAEPGPGKITVRSESSEVKLLRAIDADIASAQSALDQAEREAVDASHDAIKYDAASAKVVEQRRKLEALQERRKRLTIAVSIEREQKQGAYVGRVKAHAADLDAAASAVRREIPRLLAAENKRHEEAVKAIEQRLVDAQVKCVECKATLALAESGVDEAGVTRIEELQAARHECRRRCGEDVDRRKFQADSELRSAKQVLREGEALGSIARGTVAQFEERVRAAQAGYDELDLLVRERDAECARLTAEIDAIKAAAGQTP